MRYSRDSVKRPAGPGVQPDGFRYICFFGHPGFKWRKLRPYSAWHCACGGSNLAAAGPPRDKHGSVNLPEAQGFTAEGDSASVRDSQ